jgi:hypothetical protein
MTPTPPRGFVMLAPDSQAPSNKAPPLPPGFEILTPEPAFDVSGPDDAVRSRIAALPEGPQRDAALRSWSDARVAKDRSGGGVLRPVGEGLRSIARGAGFGYADEIEASLQGGLHKITGGAMGAPYDETLEYERAYDRASDTSQGPVVSTALKIAGGLPLALPTMGSGLPAVAATGAVYGGVSGFGESEGGLNNRLQGAGGGAAGGALLGSGLYAAGRGINAARRAYANQGQAGAYGQVADGLPTTVDEFANEVAAGASRNNVVTNRRTMDILGEEMQRAGGDTAAAQSATIARIVSEQGVTPQTAAAQIRRLTAVHADSPLMLGEYPAVSASNAAQRQRNPANIDLDELGRVQNSTTHATFDYLANNGNAQSAQTVRNAISRRQEDLDPAMRDVVTRMGPVVQTGPRTVRPADITDVQTILDDAARIGGQEYRAAYAAPINNQVALNVLPRLLQGFEHQAAGRSGEYADAMRRAADQFYIQTPNGQRLAMNTLQQLQDARGALRGQMDGYAAQNRNDLARVIRPMYQRITRLMEAMSPQWAQANRRWADMKYDEVARDLGEAFAEKAGPRYRENLATYENLAPQAQQIVQVHLIQKMMDKLDNLGDSHSISKLFANDQSRNMIRAMFGDEAAVSFARAIRDQKVAEMSNQFTKNAATHRRGMAQKQMDAETGLVSAVENANAQGVRNWLLERASQLLSERKNRPKADILTTPMNDTARVSQHIYNMGQQQRRLQEFERPSRVRGKIPGLASGQAAGQKEQE